jgi:ABC-type glycerol-3-phosphate transport system permease component
MAASFMMIIPMIILFVIGQRFFVEGIKLGAVKG